MTTTTATAPQLRHIARLAAETGADVPAVTTIQEASAAIDALNRRRQQPEGMRFQIAELLKQDLDLRWFDASLEGVTRPTNAGESVRKHARLQAQAEAMPVEAIDAIRTGMEYALPRMDARDLTYTLTALRNCPQR